MSRTYPAWLPRETFGQRLQRLRTERGWSQGELGRRCNIATSGISHFETGAREPSFRHFVRIAATFGLTPSEMIAGVDLSEWEG